VWGMPEQVILWRMQHRYISLKTAFVVLINTERINSQILLKKWKIDQKHKKIEIDHSKSSLCVA
jgi:hypothetical protein